MTDFVTPERLRGLDRAIAIARSSCGDGLLAFDVQVDRENNHKYQVVTLTREGYPRIALEVVDVEDDDFETIFTLAEDLNERLGLMPECTATILYAVEPKLH